MYTLPESSSQTVSICDPTAVDEACKIIIKRVIRGNGQVKISPIPQKCCQLVFGTFEP